MKKLLMILLLTIGMICSAHSASLKFDGVDGATGYKVYYQSNQGSWSKNIGDSTEVDLSVFNLTPGVYTFSVTAYNTMGESLPSNTADWTKPIYTVSDDPKPVTIVIPGPVTIIVGQ